MEKTVKYLVISIGMGFGGYLPMLFGASGLGLWSILGAAAGGVVAIVFISRMDSY